MTFLPQGYNGTLPVNLNSADVANQSNNVLANPDESAAIWGSGSAGSSLTIPGVITPETLGVYDTFVLREQVIQATSGCKATLQSVTPFIVGNISGTPDSSHTWTGQTSGATFTPSGAATSATLPNSPNFSISELSTEEYMNKVNVSNLGSEPL
jgi:hypothetical protein